MNDIKIKGSEEKKNGITSGPIAGSKKIYVKGGFHNVSVGMREIILTNPEDVTPETAGFNHPISVYDTSGAFSDPDITVDINQ